MAEGITKLIENAKEKHPSDCKVYTFWLRMQKKRKKDPDQVLTKLPGIKSR